MFKKLHTCFLALLCLAGSPSSAQSKVADSPGADLLHRFSGPTVSPHSGDTHRRGETLSDTFQKLNKGAVISSPLLSSSGPRSVSLSNPWTVDGGPILRSSVSGLRSSVSRLPSSSSLVDTYRAKGQEESNTPARIGPVLLLDSLTIGDQIPAGIEFNTILNYNGGPIRLDDYQGKYLIMEFWSPYCTGSIASLPVLDKISQKYADKIQVLPLSIFPENQVETTLKTYKSLQKLSLPLITEASGIRDYFPHSTIPHVIILDPKGKVVAITGIEDLTEQNLDLLLNTGLSVFRLKQDRKIRLDPKEKLISESSKLPNKNIWFQSAMTGYIPDVNSSLIQNYEDFSHIRIVNMPLYSHYQLAFSERSLSDYYGLNRIETVGFSQEELFTSKEGADYRAWMEEGSHVFGYELIAPPALNPYLLMRQDLGRYFPDIHARVEPKKKKIYAIVQQHGKLIPESTSRERSYETTPFGVRMTRYPFQGFVYHLNVYFHQTGSVPFIDRTGLDYPIDLELEAQLSSIESLRQALRQNGLDLIEREEEIPVLVIEKTAPSKSPIL